MKLKKLRHSAWSRTVLSLVLATLTLVGRRVLILLVAATIAAVVWTFHRTRFAKRRWTRTGPVFALCILAAAGLVVVQRVDDSPREVTDLPAIKPPCSVLTLGPRSRNAIIVGNEFHTNCPNVITDNGVQSLIYGNRAYQTPF